MAGVGTRSRKRSATSSSSSSKSKSNKKSKSKDSNNSNSSMWSSKSSKSGSSKKQNAAEAQAEAMFAQLIQEAGEEDTEMLSMEGIAILGEKMGLDATTDLRILVLLWKLQAKSPGALSKDEWLAAAKNQTIKITGSGSANATATAWKTLSSDILPSLDTGFLTGSEFKDFYKFCFQFNRQGTHRTLDRELVIALLRLVLKDRVAADRLDSFTAFLETLGQDEAAAAAADGNKGAPAIPAPGKLVPQKSNQYSRITLDQWTSFWDFCVECEDLNSYDESTSAWPVLIDEYVEWSLSNAKAFSA